MVRKETARLWKVNRIPWCSSEGAHKDNQFSETYRTLTFLTLFIKAHIKRITQSIPKSPFTCASQLFVHLSTHATCRAHFILLDVIIVIIPVEEYKWWYSSLVFSHFPVALCLAGPHILLKISRVHSSSDCGIPCSGITLAVETDFKEIKCNVSVIQNFNTEVYQGSSAPETWILLEYLKH